MKQPIRRMVKFSSQTLLNQRECNLIKRQYLELMVCIVLVIATLIAFGQLPGHDFVNMDDNVYVTENPYVQKGLSFRNIKWAFTTTYAEFWHPLTWLSLMLDVQLFGLNPSGFLFMNLAFHVASTLFLFLAFSRMTGEIWQSGFIAAMFALHPLHVESVAWIAERKDVLSTCFWMLTMWSYSRYVERPGLCRYLLVTIFFVFGLMAKTMLVTLPFVLILLDYWPLNRFQCTVSSTSQPLNFSTSRLFRLIREKIPLFIFTIGACAITIIANQKGLENPSVNPMFIERVSNALVSYIAYIWKMIWPVNLAAFYPFPEKILYWQVAGACFLLILLTIGAILTIRRCPYFMVGWLWYLGTLVPVIGLVQVGPFSMADRFTYIPLIGLFIIVGWGVTELVGKTKYGKAGLVVVATMFLITIGTITRSQVRHWTDSVTLYEHVIKVTESNYLAHYNLGNVLRESGRFDEAIDHYRMSVPIHPNPKKPHNNMGIALTALGRFDEAVFHCSEALRLDPLLIGAHNNIGEALVALNRIDEAISHYTKALNIDPDSVETYNNLGTALLAQGSIEKAIEQYTKALQVDSMNVLSHRNIGLALIRNGELDMAVVHFRKAIEIKPDDARVKNDLNNVLAIQRNIDNAVRKMREALRINLEDHKMNYKLATLKKNKVQLDQALAQYQKALSTQPGFTELDIKNFPDVYTVKKEYDKIFLKHSDSFEP